MGKALFVIVRKSSAARGIHPTHLPIESLLHLDFGHVRSYCVYLAFCSADTRAQYQQLRFACQSYPAMQLLTRHIT
jgi:hypothetical protein